MLEFQNKKNIFAKGYTPNWSEDVSVVSKCNLYKCNLLNEIL